MKVIRLVGILAMAGLAACSSPSQPSATSSSPTPSETQCWTSPLTGLCADETIPVLVVKIDDVKQARPQYALNEADLVIVEPVEGGLTRLFAVYQSQQPVRVGPVRSARITDTDLVQAFGKPGFAYSGSMTKLRPYLEAASMQLVGAPQGGDGYSRDTTRNAPHNYIGDYQTLLARIDDPAAALLQPTSSWKISETPTAGVPTKNVVVGWPASEKTFVWDNALKAWKIKVYDSKLISLHCCDVVEERATTTNVFIMSTYLLDSPFGDKTGARTPYPETIGQGTGWVLTNGQTIEAVWKRPLGTDLPRWYTKAGQEIAVAAGNSWWLVTTESTDVKINTVEPTKSPSPSASASKS
ncbi:MAG: hypothetical protein RIS75_447 [Actinomycetota bacterium]|jgi:hypothetical protein